MFNGAAKINKECELSAMLVIFAESVAEPNNLVVALASELSVPTA